jgi:hypothetical protein
MQLLYIEHAATVYLAACVYDYISSVLILLYLASHATDCRRGAARREHPAFVLYIYIIG